jgi:hypothetical protein
MGSNPIDRGVQLMTDTFPIGTELDEFPLPVESSKVREFAIALLDDDPIYQDVGAAWTCDGFCTVSRRGSTSLR